MGILSKVVNGSSALEVMSLPFEGDLTMASASRLLCNRHIVRT